MNRLVGLVALFAISAVNAGVFQSPQNEVYETDSGYQTPFRPIAVPQNLPTEELESTQLSHENEELEYQPQAAYLPAQQSHYEEAQLHSAQSFHEGTEHLATAQYQVAATPFQGGHVHSVPLHAGHVHSVPLHHAHVHAAAPILSTPVALTHAVHPVLPQPTVQLQKTIIKHVQVPYPVDKYVKVDRHVPVYIDKHYKVDRPYEVVKYVQKPYIVKVERKVHVPVIQKVAVPQPIIQVEPVVAEPQHITLPQHHVRAHDHHMHYEQHHNHHGRY